MSRIRPFEYLPPADYKLYLKALRDDRCVEYPLVGWPAIADWLVRMKFTRLPPTAATLCKYRKLYGMPVSHQSRGMDRNCRRKPWTINLMMAAWLATQGRVLSLPRWHPFRLAMEPRPLSQKPSAVRMRRKLQRDFAARVAAVAAHQRDTSKS